MNSSTPTQVTWDEVNGYRFPMCHIPAGTFWMGSEDGHSDEKPVHEVKIKRPFLLGMYPVTQALWKAVMGADDNPAYFKGDERPVESVSWDRIQEDFLPQLNRLTGHDYRLPSEAQWEYAAKAGSDHLYAGSNRLDEVAWYDENSHDETKPVGLKLSNAWGLHDMSGNVFEWCEDVSHGNYENAPDDGTAWMLGKEKEDSRMIRGGSWGVNDDYCRVSYRAYLRRDDRYYVIGFRLSRY